MESLRFNEQFALAENPETDALLLDKLADSAIPNVVALVAKNPNALELTLYKILNFKITASSNYIIEALAENPKSSGGFLKDLIESTNTNTHFYIAGKTKKPLILKELFNVNCFSIQSRVLLNPYCPIRMFESVTDEDLQRLICEDCNTPSWVLRKLVAKFPQAMNHPNYVNDLRSTLEFLDYYSRYDDLSDEKDILEEIPYSKT